MKGVQKKKRTLPNTYLDGNSRWIRDFSVKGKSIKLLEDGHLYGMRNYFLNKTLTAQTVEEKMGKKSQNTIRRKFEITFHTPQVGKNFKV